MGHIWEKSYFCFKPGFARGLCFFLWNERKGTLSGFKEPVQLLVANRFGISSLVSETPSEYTQTETINALARYTRAPPPPFYGQTRPSIGAKETQYRGKRILLQRVSRAFTALRTLHLKAITNIPRPRAPCETHTHVPCPTLLPEANHGKSICSKMKRGAGSHPAYLKPMSLRWVLFAGASCSTLGFSSLAPRVGSRGQCVVDQPVYLDVCKCIFRCV
jgi:hypothetical protein